jgi:hypothetical protein
MKERTGGGVGTKVEGELEEGEADDEGSLADMINLTREDSEEESRSDKATELEPFTTDDVDREERKVVAWQETESGDDDLERAKRALKEIIPRDERWWYLRYQ